MGVGGDYGLVNGANTGLEELGDLFDERDMEEELP